MQSANGQRISWTIEGALLNFEGRQQRDTRSVVLVRDPDVTRTCIIKDGLGTEVVLMLRKEKVFDDRLDFRRVVRPLIPWSVCRFDMQSKGSAIQRRNHISLG